MNRLFIFIALLFLSPCYLFPQNNPRIFPENARLEQVFSEGFSTEGPAEDPSDGMIYFSDQTFTSDANMQAGHIWKYDPHTGKTVIFRSPSGMANGIKFDPLGRMIVAEGADFGGRCIVRTDMKTGKSSIITGLFEGKPFNSPNDLTIDEKERIYFTDPRYAGYETVEQPVMGVYRIDRDGKVFCIISDVGMPNGIAVSPDQKTLYVGCFDEGESSNQKTRPRKMALYAYELSEDGTVSKRRMLVDYNPNDGPDGIVVDQSGNLYVAVRNESRPGIYVYTSGGKEISYVPTPEITSNLAFSRKGGKRYLYITAGKSLYRIEVLAKGYFVTSKQ